MNSSYRLLCFVLLAITLSSAAICQSTVPDFGDPQNRASRWFQAEYGSFFKPSMNDTTPPAIYGVGVTPSSLKYGDPRAEINAFVYDQAGVKMVYAEVGGRMNLMLDLKGDGRYTGYCASNLAAGVYKVSIVALDRAGNAARNEQCSFTILDPRDMDGDGIEDSLKHQDNQLLKVIVLHDGNSTNSLPNSDAFSILPGSSMTVPGNKLNELSKLKGVKGIYQDQKLKVQATPGEYSSGAEVVDDPRKNHDFKGDGITIALLDTGVDPNHSALAGGKIVAFKDFVNNQTKAYDDNGHGTHVASLLVGSGQYRGVAPDAKLVVVKVMDKDGSCYLSDAIKALDWCMKNKDRYGIKVISFSVGGEGPTEGTSLLDQACNGMVDKGVVMCVAAGNSGPAPQSIVIPGDAEKVITVGAIDSSGSIFDLSSRGPTVDGEIKPDIVTLGVNVVSALAGSRNDFSSLSGTSMAVPQVSGSAAILLEADSSLKPADVKRILLKTADDLGQKGPDNVYGYGALNLTGALNNLKVKPEKIAPPALDEVDLNEDRARVGDPVVIEARASGEVKEISSHIKGPDRTMEIPMDDFDSNGVYTAWWETSFWKPGNYNIEVQMQGRYGEVSSSSVPFYLDPKT